MHVINPEMEEYELVESIGFGSFSTVYKGKRRGLNDNFVAIKIAKIETDHQEDQETGDRILVYDRKRIEREIDLWKPLNHDNLCRLLQVLIDEKEGNVSFVMEYVKNGDLLTILSEKGLGEDKIKGIFLQLCRAVGYLHDCGLVHGDIKLENILVDGDKIKLSDFGLARKIACGEKDPNCNCGTVEYAAPELLQNDPVEDPFKVDIWSLGVALYALLYRRFPFDGPTPKILKIRILTSEPVYTEIDGNSELAALVKNLLKKNPSNRPSIKEIIEFLLQ